MGAVESMHDDTFTTKELFDILRASERSLGKELHDMSNDITGLRIEIMRTQEGFKKYNNLHDMLDSVITSQSDLVKRMQEISDIQLKCSSREGANYSMSERIRVWLGWVIAVISLGIHFINFVRGW